MCAIQNHVWSALRSTGKILSPSHLVQNLRCISQNFCNFRQEDAHEYMVNLLESMHRCCSPFGEPSESPSAYEKSLVNKIFGGCLRSQVKCMECSYCSDKFDPFLDLSLDIVKAESLCKALAHFTATEHLDGGEKQYQCPMCKEKVRAAKQLTVHKAPLVLTFHLKRFDTEVGGQKIDKEVDFGLTLDMKPFVSNPYEGDLKYTLYGVLVHAGWSIHSGHYYCFVRTSRGIWHLLDDNKVFRVSEKVVLKQKAYMLFYDHDRRGFTTKKPHDVVHKETAVTNTMEDEEHVSALSLKETILNSLMERRLSTSECYGTVNEADTPTSNAHSVSPKGASLEGCLVKEASVLPTSSQIEAGTLQGVAPMEDHISDPSLMESLSEKCSLEDPLLKAASLEDPSPKELSISDATSDQVVTEGLLQSVSLSANGIGTTPMEDHISDPLLKESLSKKPSLEDPLLKELSLEDPSLKELHVSDTTSAQVVTEGLLQAVSLPVNAIGTASHLDKAIFAAESTNINLENKSGPYDCNMKLSRTNLGIPTLPQKCCNGFQKFSSDELLAESSVHETLDVGNGTEPCYLLCNLKFEENGLSQSTILSGCIHWEAFSTTHSGCRVYGQVDDIVSKEEPTDRSDLKLEKVGLVKQLSQLSVANDSVHKEVLNCHQREPTLKISCCQDGDIVSKGVPTDQSDLKLEKVGSVKQSSQFSITNDHVYKETLDCHHTEPNPKISCDQDGDIVSMGEPTNQSDPKLEKHRSVEQSRQLSIVNGYVHKETLDCHQVEPNPKISCGQDGSIITNGGATDRSDCHQNGSIVTNGGATDRSDLKLEKIDSVKRLSQLSILNCHLHKESIDCHQTQPNAKISCRQDGDIVSKGEPTDQSDLKLVKDGSIKQSNQLSIANGYDHKGTLDSHQTEPTSKKFKKARWIMSMHAGRNLLVRASLSAWKRKGHKRRSLDIRNLSRKDLFEDSSSMDQGTSTSDKSRVVDPNLIQQKSQLTHSGSNKGNGFGARDDTTHSNGNSVNIKERDLGKRNRQNRAVLATNELLEESSSLESNPSDVRELDGQDNRRSIGNIFMSMLTRGLEEATVARWGVTELPSSRICRLQDAGNSNTGNVLSEWDKDCVLRKRKTVSKSNRSSDQRNSFQEFLTKKVKPKKMKMDQTSAGNRPFRI